MSPAAQGKGGGEGAGDALARRFTLEEANAIVPDLARLVPLLRTTLHEYRVGKEELDDLESMWEGRRPGLDSPENPDQADWKRLLEEVAHNERTARVLLGSIQSLGVEMKDPTLGLVDFPADRGDEVVYLCWKEGEEEIVAWHDLTSGYAGRRPIREF